MKRDFWRRVAEDDSAHARPRGGEGEKQIGQQVREICAKDLAKAKTEGLMGLLKLAVLVAQQSNKFADEETCCCQK